MKNKLIQCHFSRPCNLWNIDNKDYLWWKYTMFMTNNFEYCSSWNNWFSSSQNIYGSHLNFSLCPFQDEDIYTFFEPELPSNGMGIPRPKLNDGAKPKPPGDRKSGKRGSKSCQKRPPQSPDNKRTSNNNRNYGSENGGKRSSASPDKVSWNVLDLKADNYFSCAVGRTRTNARYLLPTSDDVVSFLKDLAQATWGLVSL